MDFIADWTTAGPYRSLSWLTIVFTIAVLVTLTLTLIELKDALRTYRIVRVTTDNDGMDVLVTSTLLRSLSRLVIQLALLTLSCTAIYISVAEDLKALFWYRIVFIVAILLTEVLLAGSALNDIVARHKLEAYLRKEERENVDR